MDESAQKKKTAHAEREEKVLDFWRKNDIFQKSLEKNQKSGKKFIFYEGPPTANGHPGIHHLEARAFKDAIPRYKTMRGFYVRRKGGWDTHGLPVELQVEKALGIKSKKEIEAYGVEKFNEKCKESVWQYVHEWEQFTDRMGYWVDLKNPYITYKPYYIESVWNVIKTVSEQGLLYKDYKVVPWCPRCGTALSSHELAQGYEDVKDLAVTVKFKLVIPAKAEIQDQKDGTPNTYLLAWTTTPWTLPGNVGLAVNPKIAYVEIEKKDQGNGAPVRFILAKERLPKVFANDQFTIIKEMHGKDLVGLEYEPLYPFLAENITGAEKEKLKNAYKVYAADFVTTTDGTGIVHTAVMYGQDDFELGTKVGLPKYHIVNEDGTFKKETGFLAGKFVKDPDTDVEIIKDLAHRQPASLLFDKEKYEHSYPFCWRCHTPLIYYARDSWYIRMSELRHKLVKENEHINWEPEYIKEGRFGEWLREVKDWAISRERYWGTPLPIWSCEKCHKIKVVGSISDIAIEPRNEYYVMRHGEAENNVQGVLNNKDRNRFHLTELGKKQVADEGDKFKKELKGKRLDLIVVSPLARTQETAKIMAEKLGLGDDSIITEERLHEFDMGVLDGKPIGELIDGFPHAERFDRWPEAGENYSNIKKRAGDVLYELEDKYKDKNILIVTHEVPAYLMITAARGLDRDQILQMSIEESGFKNADLRKLDFKVIPHNHEYELDLHKPYIDEVKLPCGCGGKMNRVKEVMDVWFDSGSMPFAEDHYPFENKKYIDKEGYPADFISEAIDQTRGWFYTLHAIGVLMGNGKAYSNVICLGHILDLEGKKMSKSLGNIVDPFMLMDKYGADALRFWMYSVNQPGDSKNFDEKTVDEIVKKVFNLTLNVLAFYQLYEGGNVKTQSSESESQNVLDLWIMSRLNQLTSIVTEGLDSYKFFEPTRAVKEFIADLSQWYLRRSRDRFKGDDETDKDAALATTKHVLLTLAKVMAPFTPFLADHIYREVGGEMESVHLEDWPEAGKADEYVLAGMSFVRSFSTMALMQRNTVKINIRQPLKSLSIKHDVKEPKYWNELCSILKDEVNVKNVIFDPNIEGPIKLDTDITPELKEEGTYRELVRSIQDLRKERNFTIKDLVILKVEADAKSKEFIEKFKAELKKTTLLEDIKFEQNLESKEAVVIGDLSLKLAI